MIAGEIDERKNATATDIKEVFDWLEEEVQEYPQCLCYLDSQAENSMIIVLEIYTR